VNVRLETQNGLALDINGTHVLNPTGGEAEAERVRNFIAACGAAERTFLMRNGVISCPQPLTEESIINLPADTTLPIEDQENALIAEYESQGLEDLIGFTVDVILSDEAEVEIVRSRCQGSGGSEMILLTHTVDGVEYGRLMCFG
jgi:hypothetical protein